MKNNKKINIFFDYDGTLLDSRERLYQLFCELCPQCQLNYDQYWMMKRTVSQSQMLKHFNYPEEQIDEFKKNWLRLIEEPKRLELDFPVQGISNVLEVLSKKYRLYLITNRQNTELTLKQLDDIGWRSFFNMVLVTNQKSSKYDLIKKNILDLSASDTLISDTPEDILCGKRLNVMTIAVTWGISSENVLKKANPDHIIHEVQDFDQCHFLWR